MNKQVIILVLVLALVLIVSVQAYQINDLKSDIKDGTLSISGAVVNSQSNVQRTAPQAAPAMVGGC